MQARTMTRTTTPSSPLTIMPPVWAVLLAGLALWAVAIPAAARANDNGRGRHKQLYAVPAPGQVTIDGKAVNLAEGQWVKLAGGLAVRVGASPAANSIVRVSRNAND